MDSKRKPTVYFAPPTGNLPDKVANRGMIYVGKLRPQHELLRADSSNNNDAINADDYVFMPYADGKIAADIVKVIRQRLKLGREVNELHVDEQNLPIRMVSNITELSKERVLTKEETAERKQMLDEAAIQRAMKPRPQVSHAQRFELVRDGKKRPTFVSR